VRLRPVHSGLRQSATRLLSGRYRTFLRLFGGLCGPQFRRPTDTRRKHRTLKADTHDGRHLSGRVGPCVRGPDTSARHISAVSVIDVKKTFLRFFYFCHVFTFFKHFFYFPNVFYLKNVGKVQSGKQINKKHFQNNSNETDL